MERTRALAIVMRLAAKADASQYEEEKVAFLAKAEQFKRQWQIQEEELIASDPVTFAPINEAFTLCSGKSRYRYEYAEMMRHVAKHCGIRVKYVWNAAEHEYMVRAVGYEVDVVLAMKLWASIALTFQQRLEPSVDPSKSERENIYLLRQAGIERQKVARMVWGEEEGKKSSAHAKVGKIYKEECAARGEDVALDGKGINLAIFREAYATNFTDKIWRRLHDAREAADREGGALVLHGRKERVNEAFYTLFPEDRPAERTQEVEVTVTTAEVEKTCPDCAKTTSKTGKCRMHRPYRETQADRVARERRYYSAAAHAGGAAGRRAAADVNLSGTESTPRAKRLPEADDRTPMALGG